MFLLPSCLSLCSAFQVHMPFYGLKEKKIVCTYTHTYTLGVNTVYSLFFHSFHFLFAFFFSLSLFLFLLPFLSHLISVPVSALSPSPCQVPHSDCKHQPSLCYCVTFFFADQMKSTRRPGSCEGLWNFSFYCEIFTILNLSTLLLGRAVDMEAGVPSLKLCAGSTTDECQPLCQSPGPPCWRR